MKSQVEQHGGQFWIESESGKSAEFHFTLPGEVKEMHSEGKKEVVNEKRKTCAIGGRR